jgi:hypothetical protein
MTVTLDRREQRITRLHLYFKNVKAEPGRDVRNK